MIINLVGPPAAGKSSFAARFVLEHPEFRYCAIDAYRIEFQDEEEAWFQLEEDVHDSKLVLLESSGLSWRLVPIFTKIKLQERPMITLGLTGNPDVIKERLKNRQRRTIPYPYAWDEYRTADFVIEHISESIAPIDVLMDVTEKTPEEVYRSFSKAIAEFRGKNLLKEK